MESLSCPHCNGDVLNDARFAGQVVACPNCGKPFRMPPATSVPPPTQSADPASGKDAGFEFDESSSTPPPKSGAKRRPPVRQSLPATASQEPWYFGFLTRSTTIAMRTGLIVALIAFALLITKVIDLMQEDILTALQWLAGGLMVIALFVIVVLCGLPLVLVVVDIARNTRDSDT